MNLGSLVRHSVNYSDLVESPDSVRAALAQLERFVGGEANPHIRRNNVENAKTILQRMVEVGKIRPEYTEYKLIEDFSKRVLGIPASDYIARGVTHLIEAE